MATSAQSETPNRSRRWFQFSLRSLLALMFVFACGLGWLANERQKVKARREAIQALSKSGGTVLWYANLQPAWLRALLDEDEAVGDVVAIIFQRDMGDSDL